MAQNMWRENTDRKACHYVKENRRWELLDDLSQSWMACRCCESTCPWRKDNLNGLSVRKVLGPFVMVADQSRRNMTLNTQSSEQGLSDSPVWLVVVTVTAVLLSIMGVLAMSYYLCFWRGGRLGYRPSRDLLTKY